MNKRVETSKIKERDGEKMKKILIILSLVMMIVGCQKKEPTVVLKESIQFEYGETLNFEDQDVLSKVVDAAKSTYDRVEVVGVTTDFIASQKGIVKAILKDVEKEFEFEYEVKDNTAPTITGEKTITIEEGTELDLVSKFEIKDLNKIDIEIEGNYDLKIAGEYDLQVVATDEAGNTAKHDFKLIVKVKPTANVDTPKEPTQPKTPSKHGGNAGTGNNGGAGNGNTTPTTPIEPTVACPGAIYDVNKPCDWIHPNLLPEGSQYKYKIFARSSTGNNCPVGFNWAEAEAEKLIDEGVSVSYGCSYGGTYNNGTPFEYGWIKYLD